MKVRKVSFREAAKAPPKGARKTPAQWNLAEDHDKAEEAAKALTRLVANFEYQVVDPRLKDIPGALEAALKDDLAKLVRKYRAAGLTKAAVAPILEAEMRQAAHRQLLKLAKKLGIDL